MVDWEAASRQSDLRLWRAMFWIHILLLALGIVSLYLVIFWVRGQSQSVGTYAGNSHSGHGGNLVAQLIQEVAIKQISQKLRTICEGMTMDKCFPAA
ncbi:hypothetical protein ACX80E_05645 [Arthrobacter sp. TMN-49]